MLITRAAYSITSSTTALAIKWAHSLSHDLRFRRERVATLALLTFTALSGWRSCGVDTTKFSAHAVTFRSSPTVFADTPMSGATSTTTPISGEAAELVNKQETLNWRAFCRRAQPTPSQAMASKGRQTGSRILQCTTAGCGLDEPHLRRIFSRCEWFRGRLGKDVPLGRAVQRSGVIVAIPILSGLHQYYVRI